MILEGDFSFGLPDLTDTTRTVSPTVYDHGSATFLFQQGDGPLPWVAYKFKVESGWTTPTLTIELVAADDAALTTLPVILASSGLVDTNEDGTAIAALDRVAGRFAVATQHVAKRYYGLMITAGGASVDLNGVANPEDNYAEVTCNAQSNMVYTVDGAA